MPAANRLLITMGDVAGVGPEIIARAWPELMSICRPVVVGDPHWLRWALRLVARPAQVQVVSRVDEAAPTADVLPCLAVATAEVDRIEPGCMTAEGGRAAYDYLCQAIDLTLAGQADAIVTAPLHKGGLHAAGLDYPGHTEILAERTGSPHFAMMLYVKGLGVVHVTLHMALRDVFRHLSSEAVLDKIQLLQRMMARLLDRSPRLVVAALNPHASDDGLFGDEEDRIIRPAVEAARAAGCNVTGPLPSDTLFVRAHRGAFDGVVAMYHDQGHIALKLLGGLQAVNITCGLPIVRTSVAHGTAYDIAGKGVAEATSLIEAARVAARLAWSA